MWYTGSMNIRQSKLLVAIIDQFIHTGVPVGSQELLRQRADFRWSCATVRNEMRALGEEGFIAKPHISAGRVPTAKGYRMYVRDFMEPSAQERKVRQRFQTLKEVYFQRKDQERVYDAVLLLSRMMPNIAFATVPHKPSVHYVGLANALRQPEFQADPLLAMGVVETLEDTLAAFLDHVEIDERVRYYIGDEHLLPQLQSCSVMVTSYALRGQRGAIGIMGPLRMDYAYNTVALDLIADLLRS